MDFNWGRLQEHSQLTKDYITEENVSLSFSKY